MNTVDILNEGFNKKYITDYVLDEAKISPEDKHDSDIIRGIYAKMRQSGTKQFSDEETAIMKKYGLDFSRDSWGRRDNTGLVTSDKHPLHNAPIDRSTKHGRYGHEDDVNLADRARKRNERNIDWQYRKSTPRATHDTLNSNGQWGNKKQSWSRAYDDEKMKSDYRDKYNDLYTKKRDVQADKDLLDYQNNTINQYKQQISDLQKRLANIENRRDKTQKTYNQRKADWKQTIANRRAKKNESYLREDNEQKFAEMERAVNNGIKRGKNVLITSLAGRGTTAFLKKVLDKNGIKAVMEDGRTIGDIITEHPERLIKKFNSGDDIVLIINDIGKATPKDRANLLQLYSGKYVVYKDKKYPLKNLRCVIALYNPDNLNSLDPAEKNRFTTVDLTSKNESYLRENNKPVLYNGRGSYQYGGRDGSGSELQQFGDRIMEREKTLTLPHDFRFTPVDDMEENWFEYYKGGVLKNINAPEEVFIEKNGFFYLPKGTELVLSSSRNPYYVYYKIKGTNKAIGFLDDDVYDGIQEYGYAFEDVL